MKIVTTPQEDHQIKIEAEFDEEMFANYKKRAARKISGKAKIPGFRPGKAPYDVILRYYGEGVISEEAVEILIDEQYANVLEEAKVIAGGPGSLQEIVSLTPPKLNFLVPLKPEVVLGDYKSIKQKYNPQPVTDEEVNEFLERLQKNYATFEPAERPVQKKDVVYLKVTGYEKEDEILAETPVQLVVGEDKIKDNWPFKGFSDHLIGKSEGETITVSHSFPKTSDDEKFKGRKINFKVDVQSVKTLTLPELDDEFAKEVGGFDTFKELREVVVDQQGIDKKQRYDDEYYNALIEKYVEISTIKFPPFMVEEEMQNMQAALERDLKQQNMDFDTYLKLMNKEKEAFINENIRPTAINRLKSSLLIDQLAQEEKIEVGKEEVDGILSNTLQMMQNIPDKKGKKQKISNEVISNVAYNAIGRLYNQKALDRMKELASTEEEAKKPKTKKAAEKKVESAEGEAAEAPKAKKKSTKKAEPVETKKAEEVKTTKKKSTATKKAKGEASE